MWFNQSKSSDVIGIIAGQGQFPVLLAKAAMSLNRRVIVFGLKDITDTSIEDFVSAAHYVGLGELGKMAELIRSNQVRSVVLAGGVPKKELYNPSFHIDESAKNVIESTPNRGDDHLLRALKIFLKVKCGATVLDTRLFLKNTMADKGILTLRKPTSDEMNDLRFGWRIAKGVGKMDIGQTVVVKNRVVLAVEAIEGTDSAIKRGGHLGQANTVVIKVCKPNQDRRFDLPCVGMDTIETLKSVHCRVLGVEAGKTIMIFKDKFIEAANKEDMTIVGM